MAPFFETAKVRLRSWTLLWHLIGLSKSFADVEVTEKGVHTQQFIDASDAFLHLFGSWSPCSATVYLDYSRLVGFQRLFLCADRSEE
jgi:hypothetical protein